jgi:serine/threonine protein kinase
MAIGEYRVQHLIGVGGMASVYAGIHPAIGKRVAIKVLHPHYAHMPTIASRFLREARAANRISSPHVVDVFGYGQLADKRQYMVMDLIDGVPLSYLLDCGRALPAETALPILRCAAHALAAAHAVGVIHRDLKPSNIMVLGIDTKRLIAQMKAKAAAGQVATTRDLELDPNKLSAKVVDFGIAKVLQEAMNTPAGQLTVTPIGTGPYMAPEQLRNQSVDHRLDIYAFGVTMYRVLTGSLPFESEAFIELANMHLSQPPEPPSRRQGGIPHHLEALILDCLQKEPEKRPSSMARVLSVLESPLDGRGSLAAPPSAEPKKSSTSKWLLAIGLPLLAAIAAFATTFYLRSRPAKTSARQDAAQTGGATTIDSSTATAPAGPATKKTVAARMSPEPDASLDTTQAPDGSRPPRTKNAANPQPKPQPKPKLKPKPKPKPKPRARVVKFGVTKLPGGGFIWRDKRCKRTLPPGTNIVPYYAHYGRLRIGTFTGYRGYAGRAQRKAAIQSVRAKQAPLKRCFDRHVRCQPERWSATLRIELTASGNVRRIRSAGRYFSQPLVACTARVLETVAWPRPASNQANALKITLRTGQ